MKWALAILAGMTAIPLFVAAPRPPISWEPVPVSDGSAVYLDSGSVRILSTADGIYKTFTIWVPGSVSTVKRYVIECGSGSTITSARWVYAHNRPPTRNCPPSFVEYPTRELHEFPPDHLMHRMVCGRAIVNVLQ